MSDNLATTFLDRNLALDRGARPALLCEDTEISYAELVTLSCRVGNVLRELGVRRGDRVLLACRDGIEFVAAWYGAQRIGAITAEVYTFLRPQDYGYYLRYTGAAAVVADAATIESLRAAGARNLLTVGVVERRAGEHAFWEEVDAASRACSTEPIGLDDVVLWKFTTGSTGKPKACVHPARSPIESFQRYARGVLGLRDDDRVLAVPKLFFGYARDLVAMFPFGVGASGIAFGERSTAELMFSLIERYRPTILVNVPTMMSAMVAHPGAVQRDLSSIRVCTSAGEALPAELHRKWDAAFGVPVVDGIGSSEAYHIYISNRPGAVRAGSVGQLVPGYSADVVDESGSSLPDGEIGALEVTGPTVAIEYWQAADKTAETFTEHAPGRRTVHTGDLFSRDLDGFFTHHGRADDLLKIGGVFVAPSEIEHCLIGHPDVVDCAVIGYQQGGLQRARAFVVPRAGSDVDTEALLGYVRARLAGHKRPRDIRFVTELPRTANGKLDRRALAEP